MATQSDPPTISRLLARTSLGNLDMNSSSSGVFDETSSLDVPDDIDSEISCRSP